MEALKEESNDEAAFSPLVEELLNGLSASQKFINPKFFYNEKGSQLFDQITQTDEYYPTRTEKKLLDLYSAEISECAGNDVVLIEPGAGSCEKVRHLLPVMKPEVYVPQDISAEFLQKTATSCKRNMTG